MQQTFTITVPTRVFKLLLPIIMLIAGLIIGMTAVAGQANAAVEDTTYTAITPCASFDSRSDGLTLEGKYAHLESRTYQMTGAAPADQQSAVDCGVPAGANAVLINVVAISPDSVGNLRAFATGDTGTGGIVNYSPVTPNLNNSNAVVIPLSAAGQIDIQNNCGGCTGDVVHVRGVVLGYFSDALAARVAALEPLTAQVAQLQQDVAALQALLEDVSRDNGGPNGTDRLLFTGMNLQLVDGTGDTNCTGDDLDGGTNGTGESCNGEGNLIVGYNPIFSEVQTGTHSVVIGDGHQWTTYGHLVSGRSNTASGTSAGVVGGRSNTASGNDSALVGGQQGNASGPTSVAVGGWQNEASGLQATVVGGTRNTASGTASVAAGGSDNIASGRLSSAVGGLENEAGRLTCGNSSFSADWSTVLGGRDNVASGCYSVVSGGQDNTASGDAATVSGGLTATASGDDDWRAGTLFEDN